MSVYNKMTALANEARTLSGTTDKKSIDEIIEDVTDANEEITDQSALISQILDAVNNLPEAKGDNCIDVTDITRGESDVIVDEGQVNVTGGYYPSRVVKEIPSVEQATPTITVFSTGQIIAKATQTEGYVYGGTRQKTTQLTTQAAKTVTPTTTNQTAVASGRYTTGAVTVKGDSNLKAENIKKDVTIFGVKGTYEGSGGGGGIVLETANVTLVNTNSVWDYDIHGVWVDGSSIGSYTTVVFCDESKVQTAVKQSYVVVPSSIFKSVSGNAYADSFTIEGVKIIIIHGDCTITLQ